MKKIIFSAILPILAIMTIFISPANGQALIQDPTDIQTMTDQTAVTGNLSDVGVGNIVAQGIGIVLGLLAIIFLTLTVIAGFKWMTAAGNEEQIKKASATLKAAIIGLVIVLSAYTITFFIFNSGLFQGGSGGSDTTGTSNSEDEE